MITLPNGCYCSNISVHPKNWRTKGAKISHSWYLIYRFYDSRFSKPKQVMVKGMNQYKSLKERQSKTEKIVYEEMKKLKEGYNPFVSNNEKLSNEITSNSCILKALKFANESISVSTVTKKDIKFALTQLGKAIEGLGYEHLTIGNVSKKEIKQVLEKASNSPDRFNKNRSYLMILFSELAEYDIVKGNVVREIKKKKTVRTIRKVLSLSEREKVNAYLLENHPTFHRFLHIFFHSGARISELLSVKENDVELSNQRFKVIVRKGSVNREVWRTIKDIAMPFWENVITQSGKSEFLFSKNLEPGKVKIQPYQIGKRWYRLVKKKLGIEADFYSLKHLHTTEVVELLNEEQAAKHNEHNSTAMVIGVYDVNRKHRQHQKVKGLQNKFA